MRLPVENGKEYIVFLRAGKPGYVLLDPWVGVSAAMAGNAEAARQRGGPQSGMRSTEDIAKPRSFSMRTCPMASMDVNAEQNGAWSN